MLYLNGVIRAQEQSKKIVFCLDFDTSKIFNMLQKVQREKRLPPTDAVISINFFQIF